MQLSDANDGRLGWGSNYERDLTARDLYELQDELTQQVVNAIAGSYGALARAGLPSVMTKGRQSWTTLAWPPSMASRPTRQNWCTPA